LFSDGLDAEFVSKKVVKQLVTMTCASQMQHARLQWRCCM
jgi:hypothetical protein